MPGPEIDSGTVQGVDGGLRFCNDKTQSKKVAIIQKTDAITKVSGADIASILVSFPSISSSCPIGVDIAGVATFGDLCAPGTVASVAGVFGSADLFDSVVNLRDLTVIVSTTVSEPVFASSPSTVASDVRFSPFASPIFDPYVSCEITEACSSVSSFGDSTVADILIIFLKVLFSRSKFLKKVHVRLWQLYSGFATFEHAMANAASGAILQQILVTVNLPSGCEGLAAIVGSFCVH